MRKALPYLLVFASVIIAAFAIPDFFETYRIATDADEFVSTKATVLSHQTRKHSRGPSMQDVRFKYRVGNREYEGTNYWTRTTDDWWEIDRLIRLEKGQKTILVYYDPDDPSRVVIKREVPLLLPAAILAGTILLFVFGLNLIAGQRRRLKIAAERDAVRRRREREREAAD